MAHWLVMGLDAMNYRLVIESERLMLLVLSEIWLEIKWEYLSENELDAYLVYMRVIWLGLC